MGFNRQGFTARFIPYALFFSLLAANAWAQRSSLPLITQTVDDANRTLLRGNVHPLAQKQFDRGAAPDSMPLHRMMLLLQRSPQQEHTLVTLLDAQQDKSSPYYHKWLTPDEFGQQFGPSDADVQTVTSWLQAHGFQVTGTSKGRTIIEFEGSAGQVQQSFHTPIHSYLVNGERHRANASDPQIPAALAPVVAGPVSLNNFPRKAQNHFSGIFSKAKTSPRLTSVNPGFTFFACGSSNCYGVVPYDFATIYNVLPLWNTSIDGTGQTIAIVGRSNINIQDVRDFRSLFGLPAKDPNIILNGPDPGLNGDESEADIDVQWSGAVAKGATIDFVVSETTETTDGIDLSAEYIIDNNLAGVMSESYGLCELGLGTAGNAFYNALWEQAAAQGITVMVSTGDSGSASCDQNSGTAAQFGLAVSGIASTPFNVAVGGTDFNDAFNPQTYWSPTNDPTTQESALSYIPETTWNNTCTNSILAGFGYSSVAETNCNDPALLSFGLQQAIGGSGGPSNCTTNSQQLGTCSGGYTKPSWQSGRGVPTDGKRDLPDVSLFASNGFFTLNFYMVCESDISQFGTCDLNSPFTDIAGFGGTSVSSPAFAGIMALVNQQNGRQGNANYVLYKLAANQTSLNCDSSNGPNAACNFYDITSGTIAMPCIAGSLNCKVNTAGHSYGELTGYATTIGYDPATGLGTVNANNLVANWNTVSFLASTTTLSLNPTTLTHGQSVNAAITVTPSAATGPVSLLTSTGKGVASFNLTSGGSTTALPGGTYTVHAHYGGNGTYGSSDSAPVSVTVAKENSATAISMITFDALGNILNPHATTAGYGSPYILRMDVTPSSGTACSNCPSGTLTLTDNGSPLDGGSFVLNNQGYAEDQPVQFPGGTNAVQAAYPGDNGFNPSTANATFSITPATTTTVITGTSSFATVGMPYIVNSYVQTQSSGLAPTGTVSFFANGAPLGGTVTYTGFSGSSLGNAALSASLSTTLTAGGTYTITASYGGDGNYNSSSSKTFKVTAMYPTPTMSIAPSAQTVQAGSNATLTAMVNTSSHGATLGGTVTFFNAFNGGTVPGNVTLVSGTDASGNPDLQATLTFTPTTSEMISAGYSGDVNYPSAQSGGSNLTVTGSDFDIFASPTSVTVTRGQTKNLALIIAGQSSYNGTISFTASSCSGLPAESTCSFLPTSITGSGSDEILINTTAPHASARASLDRSKSVHWTMGLGLMAFAIMLTGGRGRRRYSWLGWLALALLMFLPACGGGSGSGGGGGGGMSDPGTPVGNYTVTVTATSGSLSHNTTFTLTVQ